MHNQIYYTYDSNGAKHNIYLWMEDVESSIFLLGET